MDQVFDSEESSSGCESGWTLYLQHSITIIHDCSCKNKHNQEHDEHDHDGSEDDDDMSMVSDASSGPPHLQEQDEEDEENMNINGVFCDPPSLVFDSRKRRKILKQKSFYDHSHLQDLSACLDDTASSPFFSFSNKDIKVCTKEGLIEDDNSFHYSQGHSATNFEMV